MTWSLGDQARLDHTPEPTEEDYEKCLRLLEKNDALDLAPVLGLA